MENEEKILLSVNEVAAILELNQQTVRNMANDGRMPKPIKVGGSVRWKKDTIFEWIESGCPTEKSQERGERGMDSPS